VRLTVTRLAQRVRVAEAPRAQAQQQLACLPGELTRQRVIVGFFLL